MKHLFLVDILFTVVVHIWMATMKGITTSQASVEVDVAWRWPKVLIRNFVPAYITRLETATDVLKQKLQVNAWDLGGS